jgi:hypothetical protein
MATTSLDFDDVLVQGDIQEEEGFIRDICDVAAAEKISQLRSGLNHCNYFLCKGEDQVPAIREYSVRGYQR